ncbi:hypothetical protein BD310DRAFT_1007146, partial [Dichomitus squalens]
GDPTTESTVGVDLSLCSTLERLDIGLDPELVSDGKPFDNLKAMLNSWDSQVPVRDIHLDAYPSRAFTRKGFADLLGTVGRVLEELFHD